MTFLIFLESAVEFVLRGLIALCLLWSLGCGVKGKPLPPLKKGENGAPKTP